MIPRWLVVWGVVAIGSPEEATLANVIVRHTAASANTKVAFTVRPLSKLVLDLLVDLNPVGLSATCLLPAAGQRTKIAALPVAVNLFFLAENSNRLHCRNTSSNTSEGSSSPRSSPEVVSTETRRSSWEDAGFLGRLTRRWAIDCREARSNNQVAQPHRPLLPEHHNQEEPGLRRDTAGLKE